MIKGGSRFLRGFEGKVPFSAPFGAVNSSHKRNGAFSKVPVNTV